MTTGMTCYDCRFFSAAQNGRAGYNTAAPMVAYQEGVSGFCHRRAPQHGRLLKQPNGDTVVGLAEWPKVFTHDWCGEFEPRATLQCPNGCSCKPSCSPKIKNLCKNQRAQNN